MAKIAKKRQSNASDASKTDDKSEVTRKQNRSRYENSEKASGSRKMPKRAAACSDFKEKSLRLSIKASLVENRWEDVVEDEKAAIYLTAGKDDIRPNRRLTDFAFHDACGNLKSVEMLEVGNLFVSGLILPLEKCGGRQKEKGVRCKDFGRVESWAISGYEEGSPVFWISTLTADYDCVKPANNYKMLYNLFIEKAHVSVEVYRKLSRTCGGNPDLTVNELLAGVVRSMSDSKNFPHRTSMREFIISQGEFIYNQLIGLDGTSKKNDQSFENLPVLRALLDETKKQGSLLAPETTVSSNFINTDMEKIAKGKQSSAIEVNIIDEKCETARKQKRSRHENSEESSNSWKVPKRAAACMDIMDKSLSFSRSASFVESTREVVAENEEVAISLTAGKDDFRPNRRLTEFAFHDACGNLKSVEMLEVGNLFVSGLILPLEKCCGRQKERGVRCEDFGRVESWAISGYEEGSPVFWISTVTADYDCVKPANSYKMLYNLFYEKARASVEVYKKLSSSCGGNPDQTVDELLAGVVRSMSDSKNFPHRTSMREFIISQGEFIYNQLIGLDDTSKKNDQIFENLPVLLALLDETKKQGSLITLETSASSSLINTGMRIGEEEQNNQSSSSVSGGEEDKDMKLARLLQEEENWQSTKHNKTQRRVASSSKFCSKINEDEIVDDYPLPAYYKPSEEENDEYLIFDAINPDELPRRMLHNWSLYNSDSRLISLELLPMKPCDDNDITIFGSGIMTTGDSSGICVDANFDQSSSVAENVGGIPVYLSAIQEWMIEFGYSFVSISVRTDISWYRLGRPSKQYAAWFKPVLKTARLAIALITMLNNQSRASRLSFADVIKKVSKFSKTNPAYISSNPTEVERYVVVHGHIILQQFAELPNKRISKCAFVSGLFEKMEERRHTRSLVKKKVVLKKEINSNLRASKNKVMQATTTRLIKRIWEEFYSNYLPEDSKEAYIREVKVDEELDEEHGENSEEDPEDIKVEQMQVDENMGKFCLSARSVKPPCSSKVTKWDGELIRKACFSESLYKRAIVCGNVVNVGGCVLVETADSDHLPSIYFVEFMFEKSDSRKMVHGRHMLRGSETFLGNTADANEVFLTNDCLEIELEDVKEVVAVEILLIPWGHQHRKTNACKDKIVRERAEDRRIDQFPMEYYCKSLYWPERGAFFKLPKDTMGLGTGVCHSCKIKETGREKDVFKVNLNRNCFTLKGTEYHVNDYVYVAHHHFADKDRNRDTFRNEGMKAYVVCQLLGIEVPETSTKACPGSTKVKVRRFFRPEDISEEKAYYADIREVYYSKLVLTVPVTGVEGKCDIRKKHDLAPLDSPTIFEHIFFCEHLYDPDEGTIKQLPPHIKTSVLKERVADDTAYRKINGKCKEEKHDGAVDKQTDAVHKNRLATLDIFAGCGGLSDGLQQAGVSITNWAIEYEQPAGEAFKVNHPEALVFINNCNVILRAIMSAGGDADDCISTPEASELAAELDEETIKSLPRPGQVDFISGGPPCQGFSGMNRFNQGSWSKVQCEMILASLSFADYFRPRFFLLENVRNFTSFNKGQTFRLTLASLLQMGYQVRFGVLQAGAYGMSQSRKRAFIWAASPEETLPEWPEPMHVFTGPELKVKLARNSHYAAVRSTANGAPFRAITVRDTIGDLPAVGNGASVTTMEVGFSSPVCDAHFIFIVVPSTKAEKHNQWKGLFGRLDWEGNFPTSVTDPHPMGMVGTCFHPDQDRIITVRECARSQGFSDSYKFVGDIQHKHRQIGNAVPPPLAFALGRKLKEAVEMKALTSQRYSCVL
ncbi:DNA (cytosine-5)-methyltransferase [Citrus sinensis]|uniref:DNA (Cytosine-5)-methyltransferase n=1 Tax=Citrus sinensis TaxID=2711 RepID=A0ACB8K7X1_CITSI|nr:DNA (cytosine-5)-methyltransferase [Citrus sinensis]